MRRDCGESRSRIREETTAERSWLRRKGRGPPPASCSGLGRGPPHPSRSGRATPSSHPARPALTAGGCSARQAGLLRGRWAASRDLGVGPPLQAPLGPGCRSQTLPAVLRSGLLARPTVTARGRSRLGLRPSRRRQSLRGLPCTLRRLGRPGWPGRRLRGEIFGERVPAAHPPGHRPRGEGPPDRQGCACRWQPRFLIPDQQSKAGPAARGPHPAWGRAPRPTPTAF